jgi:hypothetical protein
VPPKAPNNAATAAAAAAASVLLPVYLVRHKDPFVIPQKKRQQMIIVVQHGPWPHNGSPVTEADCRLTSPGTVSIRTILVLLRTTTAIGADYVNEATAWFI